ncbi:MAG: magnesium chelatase [Firmicutes bacterium]|nr:magnesium chelatase [Bacillota bacterium]
MNSYGSLIRHSGNRELFLFLEMAILSQRGGCPLHFHVEGLRGTGKTTIIRAARDILPPIERIRGCLYNCDPREPHCPQHCHLSAEEIDALGRELVPMPFLEISASAKVGTVVGTIDLMRMTDPNHPEAALLPGTIPQAHRGIVFVDEINRLADTSPELADVLLSVMGTKPGRLQIEESGLPQLEIPVQVSVWAASNPDEDPGSLEDIRRQLSDRFDFLLEMGRPDSPEIVAAVLARNSGAGGKNPPAEEGSMGQRFAKWATLLPQIEMDAEIRAIVASLYTKFNLESLRAVEALQYGTKVYLARQGGQRIRVQDLLAVAPAVLRHRVEPDRLVEILQYLRGLSQRAEKQTAAAAAVAAEGVEGAREGAAAAPGEVQGKVGFWQRLREYMSRQLEGIFPSRRGQRRRRPGGGGGAGGKKEDGGGGPGQSQPANPAQTSVLAPPHQARPLFEIAAQGSVFPKTEEGERGPNE